jgi:hypothetical protein
MMASPRRTKLAGVTKLACVGILGGRLGPWLGNPIITTVVNRVTTLEVGILKGNMNEVEERVVGRNKKSPVNNAPDRHT